MDYCAPSSLPPANLSIEQVPQFVTFGFDDNAHSGFGKQNLEGVAWASKLFSSIINPDGTHGSCSFYLTSKYITEEHAEDPVPLITKAMQEAYEAGHDIGNHTHNHHWGQEFSVDQWYNEILLCDTLMSNTTNEGLSIPQKNIVGFRTPFLGYNDNTFKAVSKRGFLYDCSIEEGSHPDQDGTNFLWPYTLDNGSPGNAYDNELNHELPLVGNYPGLWEVPSHMVIAPADDLCEKYGIKPGFRERLNDRKYSVDNENEFSIEDGKITGLDYNCLVMFGMDKEEWLGTLKYTLDLRLQGNRAPMAFGAHSDVYATGYDICPRITIEERREVVETFLSYAQSKPEVMIKDAAKIVAWMQNPTPLEVL